MTREERENAIKVIKNYDLNFHKINGLLFKAEEIANAFDCALEALEQEPKTGHWDYTDAYPHWVCCDKCKTRFIPNKEWIKAYNIPTNYCPKCGCRMKSEVEQ